MNAPEFLSKPMTQMSSAEWESLCDGCGLCCQIRVEDEDTTEIALSNIACRYLCLKSHRCTDYGNRQVNVEDCVKVTPQNVDELTWLPHSCAYRVIARGEDLPPWHHLMCTDPEKVHIDGPSMRGELISEDEIDWSDFQLPNPPAAAVATKRTKPPVTIPPPGSSQ